MTSALQNRLVGTIIVVALVVILLPEFLDGEKRTNQQEFVDIPPVLEVVQVQEPKNIDLSRVEQEVNRPIEVVEDVALDDAPVANPSLPEERNYLDDEAQAPANENSQQADDIAIVVEPSSSKSVLLNNKPATRIPEGPAIAVNQTPIKDSGWVVQLGSFRHEKNVNALLKTLNDAGYRAYSNPVMTNVGQLNKVFVGPELDRAKLERALPHLQEITNLKGKITAFEVSAE